MMRIANVRGQLTLLFDTGGADVEKASKGRFAADPQAVFAEWAAFRAWAASARSDRAVPVAEADLIAELSAILPLLPGDVIFTGTPAGIGATRKPPRFLQPGEVLSSYIEGIGALRNRFIAAATQS
jgi:fumarylacetoacetase-like protein